MGFYKNIDEDSLKYRNILKNTSLFGGIGFLKIILNIFQSKFIAVILGPYGIGLIDLFNSTMNAVGTFFNFGISTIGVKEISNDLSNETRLHKSIKIVNYFIFITSLLGCIIMMILSPLLSKITFGNYSFSLTFVFIGISLLFNQLAAGYFTILQGLQKFTIIAKISVLTSLINLPIISILYYYFTIKAIVPVFISTSFISLIIAYSYYKINVKSISNKAFSRKYAILRVKKIFLFGTFLGLSGLINISFGYLFKLIIAKKGIETLGLYTAGYAIVNTYMNIIFASMSSDYLPRLSSAIKNEGESINLINSQTEITLLVFSPLILIFITFSKIIISILYSNKFLEIDSLLVMISLGMFFRMLVYPLSTFFLAKGDKKQFFINELIYNVYNLLLGILFFKFWGILGIGFAFTLAYFIYFFQIYFSMYKYNFLYNFKTKKIILIKTLTLIIATLIYTFLQISDYIRFSFGMLLIIVVCFYSIVELNKKLKIFVRTK